tara:strand:+ start:450 stop:1511 length:1062 start_codon:yes stop_codon:yes gene_type:complete
MAPSTKVCDLKHLRRCFVLARKAGVNTFPNPLVGAVIVKNGRVIGEGYHHACGEDHAEVDALKNCTENPTGATIYVNLEPCNHHGRTPPCTKAILEAGIKRVVYATQDNNPVASGGGKFLRDNGVDVLSGLMDSEAREFNHVFFTHILLGRPHVTLKVAQTINAKVARTDSSSQWITCFHARKDVHRERSLNQAILVGKGTLLVDDPALNVRHVKGPSPTPVIIDSIGDVPPDLRIFKNPNTLLFSSLKNPKISNEVILFEKNLSRLDQWEFMFNTLKSRGVISLYVEGGRIINSFLLNNNLVDCLHVYIGPKFFASDGIDSFKLSRELPFQLKSSKTVGDSVKLIYMRGLAE